MIQIIDCRPKKPKIAVKNRIFMYLCAKRRRLAQDSQNGHARALETEMGTKSSGSFSPQRKAKFRKRFCATAGSPCIHLGQSKVYAWRTSTKSRRTFPSWRLQVCEHSDCGHNKRGADRVGKQLRLFLSPEILSAFVV